MKNRVIKFRAWNPETSEMVYNFNIVTDIENYYCINVDDIFKEDNIMQFTGLHDKHGVEIYEGDICTKMISPDENNRAPKELYRGEIVYHYGGFCLKVDDYYYPMSRTHGIINVIGNINQPTHTETGKDGER